MYALLLATLIAFQDKQNPADIIKAINAIAPPMLTGSDEAAINKFKEEVAVVARKKGELIWQLYNQFPDHEKVPALLEERWQEMFGRAMPSPHELLDKFDKDIEQFLAKDQLPANRQVAERMQARGQIMRQRRIMRDNKWKGTEEGFKPIFEKALKCCDGYFEKYPKDSSGALVYFAASQLAENTPMEQVVMERLVERYPQSTYGIRAKGRLHSLKSIGKPFELQFTDPITNQPFDMKSHRGKVILVDIWSLGCAPCVLEIGKELPALLKKHEAKGFIVVGINIDKMPEGKRNVIYEAIQKTKLTWPNHCTESGQSAGFPAEWGVFALPTQFLIDRQGNLRDIDATTARNEKIEKLLAEPAPVR